MPAQIPEFSITTVPYPATNTGNIWGDYSFLVIICSRFQSNDGLQPAASYAKMNRHTGELTPISRTEFLEESANLLFASGQTVRFSPQSK